MVGGHPFHLAGEKYMGALIGGAGGLPLIIPALADQISLAVLLASVDGLLITGSISDVEPHHYGGAPCPPGTLHDPERDALTLPLIRAAIAAGVPLLAICRGHQELNVALGGTLHARLHLVPGLADHRERENQPLDIQYAPSHPVRLSPDGLLHRLARSVGVDPEEFPVNSLHGQGIDRLAPGVQVEAVAPDGVVEAVSVPGATAFALGIQWHPEWRYAESGFSRALFSAFGAACAARADR